MNFFTQITTKLKFYPNSLCSLNTVLTLLFCELWKHGWKHWVMHKITHVVKNIKCFNNYIHIIHSKQLHLGLLKQSDHKITILHWGVPDLDLVVCLCVRQVITTPGVCCTAAWVTTRWNLHIPAGGRGFRGLSGRWIRDQGHLEKEETNILICCC